nr:MAG TPA: hypothetical protein [Caudoviricetes sp.]
MVHKRSNDVRRGGLGKSPRFFYRRKIAVL